MPELQFLKTLVFPRALKSYKIEWTFPYLKFLLISIIEKMKFIVSVKPN